MVLVIDNYDSFVQPQVLGELGAEVKVVERCRHARECGGAVTGLSSRQGRDVPKGA
jgi:anthranilate/para-aminobenzoate synthase component II